MFTITSWFKKTGSIGEPVTNAISLEVLERQIITGIRHTLCDQWWNSLIHGDDGSQSAVERELSIMREKRWWWRWNFGEDMPDY